jgi:hypothetical protein
MEGLKCFNDMTEKRIEQEEEAGIIKDCNFTNVSPRYVC